MLRLSRTLPIAWMGEYGIVVFLSENDSVHSEWVCAHSQIFKPLTTEFAWHPCPGLGSN